MNFLIFLGIWLSGVLVTRFIIAWLSEEGDDDDYDFIVLKRLIWIFSWIVLAAIILTVLVATIINFFKYFDDNIRNWRDR